MNRASSTRQAWYLLGILILSSILSFVDRQILGLQVQPIRHDLAITDTQISLLQGFAFAIFYAIAGLPLGRMADTGNRKWLLVGGILVWSCMTMACGLAHSFPQLFVARIGVGIGEAVLAPAAYSMVCDVFPKERRGQALGILNTSVFLGIGASIAVAGAVLGALKGVSTIAMPFVGTVAVWQAAFIWVGAPGIVVALAFLTVAEPKRTASAITADHGAALSYFNEHGGLFFLQITGYAVLTMAAYALSTWVPTYFVRVFNWPAAKAGVTYGIPIALTGTVGVILSGMLSDKLKRRGHMDARLTLTINSMLIWLVLVVVGLQIPNPTVAVALLALGAFFSSAMTGLGVTALQDIVPSYLRGQSTAVYLFVLNLVGLGCGPTAVALVTDRTLKNDNALGTAIILVCIPAFVIGALLLLAARAPHREQLRQIERQDELALAKSIA